MPVDVDIFVNEKKAVITTGVRKNNKTIISTGDIKIKPNQFILFIIFYKSNRSEIHSCLLFEKYYLTSKSSPSFEDNSLSRSFTASAADLEPVHTDSKPAHIASENTPYCKWLG